MYRSFLQGGIAAMSGAAASHPLDVIKVRLQIHGEGGAQSPGKMTPLLMGRHILSSDGTKGLFAGLSASLMRQAAYSSIRFGVYDAAKVFLTPNDSTEDISIGRKVVAGLIAGGVGAAIANPCDVALVRMQADGKLPISQRRNYSNAFSALSQIGRAEGVSSLWSGCCPTIARAMIVTASQFAAYDQFKAFFLERGHTDHPGLHLVCGFMAGFVASVTSNPVDVIKTRMMNAKPGAYSGPVECLSRTVSIEGPMALYKGFVPTFVRQAPYLVVTFICLEQFKIFFKWVDLKN